MERRKRLKCDVSTDMLRLRTSLMEYVSLVEMREGGDWQHIKIAFELVDDVNEMIKKVEAL